MSKMKRPAWVQTPYAKSKAQDPDGDIRRLLAKYRIESHSWTEGRGPDGRPAVMLRFVMGERPYRIMLETLEADATREELVKQVKRAVLFFLKSALEAAEVFVTPERALFAFLELPNEVTVYDAALPQMNRLSVDSITRAMLPAPRKED